MKNRHIIATQIPDNTLVSGNFSKNTKSANDTSEFAASPSLVKLSLTSSIVLFPNALIHKNVKSADAKSTPITNSLIVLPREILAIKARQMATPPTALFKSRLISAQKRLNIR